MQDQDEDNNNNNQNHHHQQQSIPPWLLEHCNRLAHGDPELVNLNLNIRRLGRHRCHIFCQALENNRILRVLNLTSTLLLPQETLIPLCHTLSHHPSLQILHLSYNRLILGSYNNPNAAAWLARALTTNTTLQQLYLDHNEIGNDGCIALATALAQNTTLRILSLEGNGIATPGATACQHALVVGQNTTLQQLRLRMNPTPPQQVAILEILCRANAAGIRKLLLLSSSSSSPAAARQPQQTQRSYISKVWPILMARSDPDVLYFLLHAQPDVCGGERV